MIKNNFKKIIDLVCAKSPLQRKKIQNYLSEQDDTFFHLAEEFATKYLNYLASENIPIDYAVDSYLKVCNEEPMEESQFNRNDFNAGRNTIQWLKGS